MQDLTAREKQVLAMIGAGMKSVDIQNALQIAPMTLRKHRANITQKLGLRTSAQLTAYAVGLTPAPLKLTSFLENR